mmetsp:Transcript_32713/g.78148  ORF Transcript_32713/g.78148 Transcript_32713/m.78148 type:complete len:261 (-) Transcript_32713:1833-2615(-)
MRPAQVLVVLILCSGYIGQTEGNWYPCTQNSDCDWCDAHPGRNYDYPTRCEIGDSDGNKFCMYIWAWTGKWCECSQVPQCQICSECCGNGQVEGGEQCDDGNSDHTDGCVECWHPRCGDGHTHSGVEQCDDGNSVDTDSCSNACACTEFQFVPGSTEISDSVACVRPPFNTPICQEARTHRQLDLAFDARKGPNRGAVSGGLGRDMTDDDRFQSWKCLKSHACLSAPGVDGTAEDFMCFAYDEQQKKFIPWGKQSNLRLF